ncbi:MAG: metallophosphoesterase [Balneolaceae bacterium]
MTFAAFRVGAATNFHRFYQPKAVLLVLLAPFFLQCSAPGQTDVTFLVASDIHYGISDSVAMYNRRAIEEMNRLPGTPWPFGGETDTPRGLLVSGDMTEDGEPEEWQAFLEDYGLTGDRRLQYPVYEGFGNHDGEVDGAVRSGIRERNTNRPGVTNISENGLHYSWSWDDLHIVNLNSYPSYEWDSECGWCHYFTRSFREPEESLQFLEKDLAEQVGQSGRQIILYFHYGFDDWGDLWWTEQEQEDFYEAIRDYNILAIFHGHSHNIQFSEWRNIPVFCVGSTQKESGPGEFMAVRVTSDSLYVAERRTGEWGQTLALPRFSE